MSNDGSSKTPEAITGIHALQGHGVKQSRGFWAEAWSQVIRRPSAIIGLAWLGLITFFAVFAPIVANGHPVRFVERGPDGARTVTYPLIDSLTAGDWLLLIATIFGTIFVLLPLPSLSRPKRLGWLIAAMVTGTVTVLLVTLLRSEIADDWFFGLPDRIRGLERDSEGQPVLAFRAIALVVCASLALLSTLWIPFARTVLTRLVWLSIVVAISATVVGRTWDRPQMLYDYGDEIRQGTADANYTIIPWSPAQRPSDRNSAERAPGETEDQSLYRNFNNRISNYLDSTPRDRNTHLDVDGLEAVSRVLDRVEWPDEAVEAARRIAEQAREIIESRSRIYSQADFEAQVRQAIDPITDDTDALMEQLSEDLSTALRRVKRGLTAPFGPEGFRIARQTLQSQPLPDEIRDRIAQSIDELELQNPAATRSDLRAQLMPILGMSGKTFPLGTDNQGQDMLSQLLHACRLSISIGLVSTGISLLIGITVGALMGYFGGWVDLVLYRVVEIFMAIPVLFLLIVAAGVLPKNIYVMMIIIGCFSWTGAARFIRAEFLKLRNMDFVQSARATGLPLRSILFKHMLPNGVTPVLVESSFAIAAAILAEATLSYLGLGPDNQASWGKLLASATGESGEFFWWLAIFPGAAIFLTVLSYNLIGEALRDAIDPKLKKARV
ncbi:MAG: ABC transporter permease subunit [bacterium]|nr:ABC transporter permease subunit [bacterium]